MKKEKSKWSTYTILKVVKSQGGTPINIKIDKWCTTPIKYGKVKPLSYGNLYGQKNIEEIDNPFLEISSHSINWNPRHYHNGDSIYLQPVWYNDHIGIDYIKLWDNHGLRKLVIYLMWASSEVECRSTIYSNWR